MAEDARDDSPTEIGAGKQKAGDNELASDVMSKSNIMEDIPRTLFEQTSSASNVTNDRETQTETRLHSNDLIDILQRNLHVTMNEIVRAVTHPTKTLTSSKKGKSLIIDDDSSDGSSDTSSIPENVLVSPIHPRCTTLNWSSVDENFSGAIQRLLMEIRRRFAHLKTLHDFIHDELSHQLKLQAQIQKCTIQEIAFGDLWLLYNPGDLLYSSDEGFEQLYRAYAITGGQPRLRTATQAGNRIGYPWTQEEPSRRTAYDSFESDNEVEFGSDKEEELGRQREDIGVGTCTPFTIDCFNIGTDGINFGTIGHSKRIESYIGKVQVTDLPIFPWKFHPSKDDVSIRLQKRGLKCVLCQGHKRYEGFYYNSRGHRTRDSQKGNVYVDFKEYYRGNRRVKAPKLRVLQRTRRDEAELEVPDIRRPPNQVLVSIDYEVEKQKSHVFLTSRAYERYLTTSQEQIAQDPDLLRLMTHHVIAFAFRSRKWVRLEIDYIEDIDKSVEARDSSFNDLVLSPKYRRLLVSLVDSHTSEDKRGFDLKSSAPLNQLDLVRGKGLGLIVLLHGPPGTGKTSTAETIASYTARPLYSITCGDLGDEPHEVEQRLEKHTSRADKWGCVLLLDEADVFLMRRDFKDSKRNALVSVFLRTLEYYSGILFLTTNRVGVIDEAFKSRVHVSLRYPKVKLKATLDIWKGCLDRIERDNHLRDIKVEFDRQELLEFAEEHYQEHHKKHTSWNGRQIRNAFQTAIALGQYERTAKMKKKGLTPDEALASNKKKWRVVELTRKNLDTIAETAYDFDKYMKSVHKDTDAALAKVEQLRDDDFSESSEEEELVVHTVGRKGPKQHQSKKKAGKSVATSSASRSSKRTMVEEEDSSSDSEAPAQEAHKRSSEDDTDDD
ncbi:hypothetical protein GGR53DRAFT_529535 [Hypoxylon sp. FL1150]|nr:hypothetical protein GGR53DRAFT_529535 [Hypoxylon sp. FL1150]